MDFDDMLDGNFSRIPDDLTTLKLSGMEDVKLVATTLLDAVQPEAAPLIQEMDKEWREFLAVATALMASQLPSEMMDSADLQKAFVLGSLLAVIIGYVQGKNPELLVSVRAELAEKLGEEPVNKDVIREAKEVLRDRKSSLEWKSQESKLREIFKDIDIDLDL